MRSLNLLFPSVAQAVLELVTILPPQAPGTEITVVSSGFIHGLKMNAAVLVTPAKLSSCACLVRMALCLEVPCVNDSSLGFHPVLGIIDTAGCSSPQVLGCSHFPPVKQGNSIITGKNKSLQKSVFF